MTIWIEYAIIDNLVINSLLLWFVFRTIKQAPPWIKIFASAAFGTIAALIMPLLSYTGVVSFVIKLFVGAVMVFIVQNKNLTRFILFYLLFFVYTFALGGALYGILFMFDSTSESLLYFTNNSAIPIGVLFCAGLAAWKLLSLCIKYLNLRHSVNNYLRDIVIHYDRPIGDRISESTERRYESEKVRVTSYLDTGNRLVDPVSRAPVVIISLSLFLKMFPEIDATRVFLNKLTQVGINDGRYISFSTVDSQTSKMFTFMPQKFEIVENKRKFKSCDNVRLGVSMRGFKDAIKYDALLNANLA